MNIVVVINRSESICRFIRAAGDWVMAHPVDTTLYIVRSGNRVQIGPYNINFVCRVDDTRGLRAIDILYYRNAPTSAMLDWEVGHRMTQDGTKFFLLDKFMEEVFRRVENEVVTAKKKLLNDIYGVKAVNYPEDFIANLKETMKKTNRPWELSDYNEAYGIEIDHLNSEILRQCYLPTGLYKSNAITCIKEETTMNCDIRSNIKDVIFSDRVTVILWKDGTKTMVRAGKNDVYDPEKGFAMAVAKKMFGNKGNYYEVFKEYVPTRYYIPEKNDIVVKDQTVAEEANKVVANMIDECQEKGKTWLGLTRKQWEKLFARVAKSVDEERKVWKAVMDRKKKQEDIKSGKYPWGVYMSNYMTPPVEDTNGSDKEE